MSSERTVPDPEGPEPPRGEHRQERRRAGLAAVAAGVLLSGVAVAYWSASASGKGDPQTVKTTNRSAAALRDSAAGGSSEATLPTPPAELPQIAPGEPDPHGPAVYRAKGPLPTGPAKASGYRPTGEVTRQDVERLAGALGVDGLPRLSGGVWTAGQIRDGHGPRLQVEQAAPGNWTYLAYALGGTDDCAPGKDVCQPVKKPTDRSSEAVDAATAKAVAAPVFKALGQDDAKIDASQTMGANRTVNADPVVDGLRTYGWTTSLQVGPDAQLVNGSGRLTSLAQSAAKPVISAEEALQRLNAGPVGEGSGIGGCATPVPYGEDSGPADSKLRPCEPGKGGEPRTLTVERAVLGLSAELVEGTDTLAPAWLFDIAPQGATPAHTVAQNASAEQAPKATAVGAESYSVADRELTVHFWGGVCSAYALQVTEHPKTVSVKIVETPLDPDRACIMIAKEMSLSATLDEPLGSRQVIDMTNGKTVPRVG
ncbi:hypothetical protein [Streptomyces sp. NPDC006879]|uniref:hypothetical protein n=1 Tax=Streptomyces sp. NPDC006879 TaxID=3364767 RepID=UPI0036BD1ABD